MAGQNLSVHRCDPGITVQLCGNINSIGLLFLQRTWKQQILGLGGFSYLFSSCAVYWVSSKYSAVSGQNWDFFSVFLEKSKLAILRNSREVNANVGCASTKYILMTHQYIHWLINDEHRRKSVRTVLVSCNYGEGNPWPAGTWAELFSFFLRLPVFMTLDQLLRNAKLAQIPNIQVFADRMKCKPKKQSSYLSSTTINLNCSIAKSTAVLFMQYSNPWTHYQFYMILETLVLYRFFKLCNVWLIFWFCNSYSK